MHVVIVGASLAGLRTAESLRAAGFDGRVTMVGDEVHRPYDRPPLSKEILTGKLEPPEIVLCDDGRLASLDVDLVLGVRATSLDLASSTVELEGGDRLPYDELIVATGARPRRLPAFDGVEGVHVLRTVEDALALRDAIEAGAALAVVGGGFVGSEVASAARDRGLEVTVIEALDAPMCRVLGRGLGRRLGRLHEEGGSRLRCAATVTGPVGVPRIEGVRLDDGSVVAADVVVIGVGAEPNTGWLATSGLDVGDGVACDAVGRAVGASNVRAVGDVARWRSARYDDQVRTEHWTAAGDQAQVVAADLVGAPPPPEAVPYVWSDQYGHRIQVGGRCRPGDEVRVVHDRDEGFVAITGRDGMLSAAVVVDEPRRFGALRRLLVRGATWDDALTEAAK